MNFNKYDLSNISKELFEDLNNFIIDNNGLIFHDLIFNSIVAEIFKTKFEFIIVEKNSEIIAYLPYHIIKEGLIKKIYSLPTIFEVPYGGWIYNNSKIQLEKLLDIFKIGSNEQFIYWSNIYLKDSAPILSNKVTKKFITSIIDLSISEDDIWKNYINSKRRNMIRKAIKSNIVIKQKNIEGLDEFYFLMSELHKKIGLELFPKEYYLQILKRFSNADSAKLFLAYLEEELLSGIFIIGNKNVMHYWQGASKLGTKNLGQGELLQWEAIKWAKTKAKFYDLCVIEKDRLPNIAKFKLGISSHEVPFFYFQDIKSSFKVLNKLNKIIKK